jgi:O-antigen ligase
LIVLACVVLSVAVAEARGPVEAFHRVRTAFDAPTQDKESDLRARLFSLSGNGRVELYRAAWHDASGHVLIGSGAGSFETYWLQHRPIAKKVRDVHSLYLETLAELGVFGLGLLLVTLAIPLALALRVRRQPGIGAAAGAYSAYLVGAAADWDWEITSVTLMAVLVGVAILAAGRSAGAEVSSRAFRWGVVATATLIGVLGGFFLIGNMFLSRAAGAAADGTWGVAARDAQRSSSWLPWSAEPFRQLGEAELAQGRAPQARAAFREAIKKNDRDWSSWLDLARASVGQDQLQALSRARLLNPRSPEIAEFESELGAGESGISITAGATG